MTAIPAAFLLAALPALPAPQNPCPEKPAFELLGSGTPGVNGTPRLGNVGVPVVGGPLAWRVSDGPASSVGLITIGGSQLPVFVPSLGGTVYPAGPVVFRTFALDALGTSKDLLRVPAVQPGWCGLEVFAQALLVDPAAQGGFSLTPALRLGFGTPREPLFPGALTVMAGHPQRIEVADFNEDGIEDVATADLVSRGVALTFGDGQGGFIPGGAFPNNVNWSPRTLAVGDLNGDGFEDVVLLHCCAPNLDIAVYLGNGDGTLQPSQEYAVGSYSVWVDIGDLNSDGAPDLVVANARSMFVSLLVGVGDGTFVSGPNLATPKYPTCVAIGLIDGDSHPDLIVGTDHGPGEDVLLYRGLGDGTFLPQEGLAEFSLPGALELRDLEGDGDLDAVLVSAFFQDRLLVLLGAGDGTFSQEIYPLDGVPTEVRAAELTGDGILDLFVPRSRTPQSHSSEGGLVEVFEGQGDGTFESSMVLEAGNFEDGAKSLDANGDGLTDIVVPVAVKGDDLLAVLLGAPDGTLETSRSYGFGEPPRAMGLGDLDASGRVDVVLVDEFHDRLALFFGLGNGELAPPVFLQAGNGPTRVALGDLDQDGVDDLAAVHLWDNDLRLWFGTPAGMPVQGPDIPLGIRPVAVAIGEFTGDSFPDLVALHFVSDEVLVLPGLGQGAFGAPQSHAVPGNPALLELTDLNGDGELDLIVGHDGAALISTHLGAGDGTFTPLQTTNVGFDPSDLILGDADQDGVHELVVPGADELTWAVYEIASDGTLQPTAGLPVPVKSSAGLIADLNGDGLADLVHTDHYVRVAFGEPGLSFGDSKTFATGTVLIDVLASDFDGDGALDLITLNEWSENVTILLNHLFR